MRIAFLENDLILEGNDLAIIYTNATTATMRFASI